MLKKTLEQNVPTLEYFGEDLSEVSLNISDFQWDGELTNFSLASCFFTIEGKDFDTEEYVSVSGAVNVDDEENFEVVIVN